MLGSSEIRPSAISLTLNLQKSVTPAKSVPSSELKQLLLLRITRDPAWGARGIPLLGFRTGGGMT